MTNVTKISAEFLDDLGHEAKFSARLRRHRNIHRSYDDACQRLFNAIEVDSYIPPHRHLLDPKNETLIAVRGLLAVVIFGDEGEIVDVVKIGSQRHEGDTTLCAGIDLSSGVWHTVIALEPGCVLFEVKAGPFDPSLAKELAPWAPAENTEAAAQYLQHLRALVG